MKKKVVVLGSSGSIGKNTVQVLETLSDRFETAGMAVKSSVEMLAEQAKKLNCRKLVTADSQSCSRLQALLPDNVQCNYGMQALIDLVTAPEVDIVVCAIVGTDGLLPVLSALKANKRVALASKEVMVMAGDLVNELLDAGCGEIIPVDSEHSAIFQCLDKAPANSVEKILLTASGGAFRNWSKEDFHRATWRDALKHPVWSMGTKITIDSATLMNKALEVVEAGKLFRVGADKIEVVQHPQSLVHSMVEFADGSVIAQISKPDMRYAIQYAMTYPERLDGKLERLNWQQLGQLDFGAVDRQKYPSLDMAFAALRAGGTLPAVMNAANEAAVDAYCKEIITLPMIYECVQSVMQQHQVQKLDSVETAIAADRQARIMAQEFIKRNQI